jgi:lysophospholipase L1-like esterase
MGFGGQSSDGPMALYSASDSAFSALNNTDSLIYNATNQKWFNSQASRPASSYVVIWSGSAWQYKGVTITTRPAGMLTGDNIQFVGNLGNPLPAWATASDIRKPGYKPSWGAPGQSMALLDSKDKKRFIVGCAADSTGDEGFEWFEAAWKALFAEAYPERAVGLRRWVKNTDEYSNQINWQTGTGSVGTVPIDDGTPTTATQNVVVFTDHFARTSADLVGSTPPTGKVWQGAAGQYETQGVVAQAILTVAGGTATESSLTTPVYALINTEDRDRCDGQWLTLFRITTATSGRVLTSRFWGPLLSNGNGMWLDMQYSNTSINITVKGKIGGTVRTIVTLPSDTLASNQTDQSIVIKLVISGTILTVSIGDTEVTAQITEAEITAWQSYDRVQFASDDNRFRSDYVILNARQTIVIPPSGAAVSPGVGLQASVYNGAIAGSTIREQADRIERMYPFRPNLIMIGHGLNYSNATPEFFLAEIDNFINKLYAKWPGVPIGIISQNPRYPVASVPATRGPDHEARQMAIKAYAQSRGWLYAGTFEAFEARPDGGVSYVMADGTHPNASGGAMQAEVVKAALQSISSL